MSRAPHAAGRLGRVLSGVALGVGLVLFLGGFVLAAVLYQPYTVPSGSMSPSVMAGDRVLAQRIDGSDVRRGDVVVFEYDTWGSRPMLKRVVGVGGDTVACCDDRGRLMVNGEPVDEPYLGDTSRDGVAPFEATVPDGELFLLGDERVHSQDSRAMLAEGQAGSVPAEAVSGRVEATVWPLGRAGLLPRAAGFAALPGGLSGEGPLRALFWATAAGAVLTVAGVAWPPLARRVSRAGRRDVPPPRVAHNEGTHG